MRNLIAILCLLFSAAALQAQTKVITGSVTDGASGDPLPGVTVMEVGTSNGAFTNDEGKYKITVSENATKLMFRFVGMKTQEVEISGSSADVTMEEDELLLDEVVVTALGIKQEKKSLGYAVQSVGGDALQNSGEVNAISGLSGKLAGVQVISSTGSPGASAFIRIRGSASLTGDNQPLIIVDGVPVDNSQLTSGNPDEGGNNLLYGVANSNRGIDLNPDDIEDVTVLKGPAASALYGIAAANGALVITTKKGSATEGKKVNVSFNSTIAFDMVNKMVPLQDEYAQGSGDRFWLDAYGLPIDTNAAGQGVPSLLGPEWGWASSWGPKLSELQRDGDPNYPWDKNGALQKGGSGVTPYDNVGAFFQTGVTTQNNLSLSGGNSNATYRFSLGDMNQKGIVPLSQFRRTTMKLAGEAQISPKFKTAASVAYVKSGGRRVQQGSNTSGLMLGLLRTPRSFDNSNGVEDPVNDNSSYIMPDGSQRNYRGGGGYDNPYWTINQNPFHDDVNRVFGFTSFSYDPAPWINIFYRVGTDFYNDRRKASFEIGSRTLSGGRIFEEAHSYRHINSDLWITLNKDFTEDLSGTLLLGHNAYDQNYQRVYTQGDGFAFPGFAHISNASSVLTREQTTRYRKAAIFAQAKLAYKNYLFLDLTGRNEWSSTLPVDANAFFYPSASLGFIFTDAFGMEDNKILPYGKLRASFASVGNDAPLYGTSSYFTGSQFGDGWTNGIAFPYAGVTGFTRDGLLGNSTLRPEQTTSFEIGTDLRFLKNRIGIDFTYYSSTSVDQILPIQIASASGYRTLLGNAGKVSNKGIELVLNATPVKTKKLRWDTQINFTRNRNLVVELTDDIENLFLGGFTGSAVYNIAGQPFGVIQGGQWLRDDAGNVVVESNPNAAFYGYPLADQVEEGILGDPNPDFLMGWRNTLSFEGLTFSFLLDWRSGGQMWNGTLGALSYFGMSELTEHREVTDHVFGAEDFRGSTAVKGTLDGDGNLVLQDENGTAGTFTNDVPVPLDETWYQVGNGSGFGEVSEHYVQDADFLKLREISLSYRFPESLIGKTFLRNVEVGVTGRNFLLWTPYTGIDPETSLTGANNAQGMDYFNMPSTQSFLINLKINL